MCNTGAPQGTVLSPFLFTIYTSDFNSDYNSGTCHLQRFSDDSSIVGCISEEKEEEYRGVVESFLRWSVDNHLQLNISKTKELIVDFCRNRKPPTPITIQGEKIEMVDSYQFLGVHINSKLDWSENTKVLYRKGQSRLFLLRRFRSFDVCSKRLQMFYQSVVACALFFAVTCWGGGVKAWKADKLNKLVKKSSSVVGHKLDNL
ncbi:RNA-directed DNA polymerase from mobile element jockey [Ictalurus punctatus]|uniref:RNA-directed DNA polymerase from mobile element jockey n=1 Tax=Ictalurus punctatus TaxID=7998 RepID=A0A2D0RM47_ICTPU|nr:RNA-directed DNA polymerase from mobile element jockey [Ictalurus punctatus]